MGKKEFLNINQQDTVSIRPWESPGNGPTLLGFTLPKKIFIEPIQWCLLSDSLKAESIKEIEKKNVKKIIL